MNSEKTVYLKYLGDLANILVNYHPSCQSQRTPTDPTSGRKGEFSRNVANFVPNVRCASAVLLALLQYFPFCLSFRRTRLKSSFCCVLAKKQHHTRFSFSQQFSCVRTCEREYNTKAENFAHRFLDSTFICGLRNKR